MKSSQRKEPVVKRVKAAAPAATPQPRWWQWTIAPALLGSCLLWASFPPLDLWPLAWLAPLPWLYLIRQPKLLGPKPYLQVWFAGCVHWLLMLQGIRLAHPALYGGWVALSAYLAVFLVLFIALARVAVQQCRWPLWLAATIVWVGLELLRGHLISGFSCGLLAHTQTALPLILQIADLGGAYALSGLMMLVAAIIAQQLPAQWFGTMAQEPTSLPLKWLQTGPLPIATSVILLALSIGYGYYRLQERPPVGNRPPLRVALIQGSLDTKFDQDPNERFRESFTEYGNLTSQAVAESSGLDLVVWPESAFAVPEFQSQELPSVVNPHDPAIVAARLKTSEWGKQFTDMLEQATTAINRTKLPRSAGEAALLPETGTSFLFGTTTLVFNHAKKQDFPERNFNAALLAGPTGQISGRYYKIHAVMFGEYIPVADLLPFLYSVTPMGAGMSTGKEPATFAVKGYSLTPNICFESTVPHLVREQVIESARQSKRPVDAIVNVSNDGWFWGSSILDLHFRCSVFRAIENRKPVIIAANTGISAHIDGNGRVLQRCPKRTPQPLVVNVIADGRSSPYHLWGDIPAWLCAWITWGLALYAIWWRGL